MKAPYVLYVCQGTSGSDIAMNIAMKISALIHIQSVYELIEQDIKLPGWLQGVPTLIHTTTGELLQGTQAIIKLQEKMAEMAMLTPVVSDVVPTTTSQEEMDTTFETPSSQSTQNVEEHEGVLTVADPEESAADDGFAPLAPETDKDEDDALDSAKVNMDDIQTQLSLRGLS